MTELRKTRLTAPQGTSVDGSVSIAVANIWYAIPATPPTTDYVLTITLEIASGTIRWARTNGTAPSSTFGQLAMEAFPIDMKGGTSIYYASDTAVDRVNYSTIEQI